MYLTVRQEPSVQATQNCCMNREQVCPSFKTMKQTANVCWLHREGKAYILKCKACLCMHAHTHTTQRIWFLCSTVVIFAFIWFLSCLQQGSMYAWVMSVRVFCKQVPEAEVKYLEDWDLLSCKVSGTSLQVVSHSNTNQLKGISSKRQSTY